MDRLVPPSATYHHNEMQGDTNAHAHLQAAIIGPSETVPVKDGHILTGTWQQFVLRRLRRPSARAHRDGAGDG